MCDFLPSESAFSHGVLNNSSQDGSWNVVISPIIVRTTDEGSINHSLSSSSDDTSDEAYRLRHMPYEFQEENASMRVYQDCSFCTDQDLSGLSCIDEPQYSPAKSPQSTCHPLKIEKSVSQLRRIAAQNLIQAEPKAKAFSDSNSQRINIDCDAKIVLQIEEPTFLKLDA